MADTKFYQDFHYPLPLVRRMRMLQQEKNQNDSQLSASREWFSQPRTATGQNIQHTLFAVRGTGGRTTQNIIAALHPEEPLLGNYDQQIAVAVDKTLWRYVDVAYPGDSGLVNGMLNMNQTSQAGTEILIDLIRNTEGKFGIVGLSQGAIVASNVYDEIRYGVLQDRRADFIGGVMLGNPRRQTGYTFPGGIDPGVKRGGPPTHGAMANDLLTNCEPELWWELVNDFDSAADVDDSQRGQAITGIFEFLFHNYLGEGSIIDDFWEAAGQGLGLALQEIVGLAQAMLGNLFGLAIDMIQGILGRNNLVQDGHLRYHLPFTNLPGRTNITAIDLGVERFNQIGRDNEFTYIDSPATECITINFRLPFSVSEISTEILKMPCIAEIWYLDRSNNWRPVLDAARIPLSVRVDRADTKSWYKWSTKCYPIVAKRVQLRLTRTNDPVMAELPYPVGVRNTLIKRNVYDRSQGGFFEDEVDVMGNVVSKYVRDWDASQAADDNYTTFWKSAPLPDPEAVANLFLDVRSETGAAQVIDRLYLDPVYSNQTLNIYYSDDDTVGTRILSPITVPPPDALDSGAVTGSTTTTLTDNTKNWTTDRWKNLYLYLDNGQRLTITGNTDTRLTFAATTAPAVGSGYRIGQSQVLNADWRFGVGMTDVSTGNSGVSSYCWPMAVGPQNQKAAWIGVEWKPDFGTVGAPNLAANPTLFAAQTGTQYRPSLYYQMNTRRFVLELAGTGLTTRTYPTTTIAHEWNAGDSIKVVAGWRYGDTRSVYIKVTDNKGRTIATYDQAAATLPDLITFDGVAEIRNFRGTVTNLVVKLENPSVSSDLFLVSPQSYCDPDPVIPDNSGKYPSTTLDNAVYVAPFQSREHGSGNADQSHFEDKEWTPIWRDYIAIKGMLFFPQAISMKYLKLEFTNLTEQPYPIYESGIETRYKVFPISVLRQSGLGHRLYTGEGGFLGLGSFISVNGVKSVNFLDPNSVLRAVGGMIGRQVPPVQVNIGTPYITDTLPNNGAVDVQRSMRIELGSSYVYVRDELQPYILAEDKYNTLIKAEGLQAIQPMVDIPWNEIQAANPNAITKVKTMGTMPLRGSDWWIYPGQQLKVPAAVMQKLTDTQTVTERKYTLERRVRFNTTSVHRYDYKVLKRDAAIAYFAGVREVQPYISTYIDGEDTPVYKFPAYTGQHWVFTNIQKFKKPEETVGQENSAITTASASAYGMATKEIVSQSRFSKVSLDFQDSGIERSNPMWVDIDQKVSSIEDTELSPYFKANPDLPQGNWLDTMSTWKDANISWGEGVSSVRVTIDPDRRYDGRRVIHFTRESNAAQQAGINIRQWLNFTPGAQMRIGATIYRPKKTTNQLVLQLKRNGVVILKQTIEEVPEGTWFEAITRFMEVPEAANNASFDNGLSDWTGTGGTWSGVSDKGYTGLKSAKLTTNGSQSTLTNITKIQSLNGTQISASAWVSWEKLTPGTAIYLNALLYNNSGTLVRTVRLSQQEATVEAASTSSWRPISGSTQIPAVDDPQYGGVTQVAFQVVVPADAGSGGNVWVDDFSCDVPGSPRQQYVAELNLEGTEREELYVSDLYTEIAPVRYYVQFGVKNQNETTLAWDQAVTWDKKADGTDKLIEVTDLRYTNKNLAVVTRNTPANAMRVQVVIASPRAYAFGCTITPSYLK